MIEKFKREYLMRKAKSNLTVYHSKNPSLVSLLHIHTHTHTEPQRKKTGKDL